MAAVVKLLSELSSAFALVEHVPPDDPMFRRLARGRDVLYRRADRELFISESRRYFDIVRSDQVGSSGRELFLLRKQRA